MMTELYTFLTLIKRDFAVFLPDYKDRFINGLLWIVLVIGVFEYIMPQAGLVGFGVFIAVSSIGSWGIFNVMNSASEMIADLEGERSITYYLTLPLPQWMVFARIAVSNALQAIAISTMFIPISKLLLWEQFNWAQVSWSKFVTIFVLANIFYGFFSLFLASCIKNFKTVENVWMRIVWPIFYLGCYQFRWSFVHTYSPKLAYVSLINPMVFIMEGIRGAIFGQEGSLPFLPCAVAIVIFTIIFGTIGIKRLQKRLDCL